jgi:ubiquinone/menaquinone biosynthesis C-methylase UbiE
MLREIAHFVRTSKEFIPLQKQHPRAEFFDIMSSRADAEGYADVRRELVGDLHGRVLDIGCGTGAMFPHYPADTQVEAIEPEADFLAIAVEKAKPFGGRIHTAQGDAMRLDFNDGQFDAVVLGLVLCSVPSVERVLAEAFRVLKKGGQLRALDHVRSDATIAGLLMDITNPLWLKLNKQGCNWNRNPLDAMRSAGFAIDDVQAFQRFDTCLPAFPMRRVRAHKAR